MTSLAVKYRPSSFDDLVGQLHASRSLKNSITFGKVGHAYLFFGSRGVGKTSTARILARSLNCLTQGPTPSPCNECENCTSIPRGNCIDVIEMDAASNRGIEYIRELRENAKFAPMRSRYKIYIIDEVHMLTNESFNALLKTLEEPPPHVVFILATTEYHKIPETILSRCQSFAFKRFDGAEIKKRLKYILDQEKIAYNDEALFPIAERGEGSMRDAISLLDQVIAFVGDEPIEVAHVEQVLGLISHEQFYNFLQAMLAKEQKAALLVIDNLSSENHNLKRFLWEFLNFVKTLLLVKEKAIIESHYSKSFLETAQQRIVAWQSSELILVFENLYRLYNNWSIFGSSRSSEIRVSLEVAILDLIIKLSQPSVAKLVEKISRFSQAISEGTPYQESSTDEKILDEKTLPPENIAKPENVPPSKIEVPAKEEKTILPSQDNRQGNPQANPPNNYKGNFFDDESKIREAEKKMNNLDEDPDIVIQRTLLAEEVEVDPQIKKELFD